MGTTNLKLSAILIVVFIASVYGTCKRKLNCSENIYKFELNVTAIPGIDSITLNDTLWFSINESTQLKDLNSGNIITFDDAANLSLVFGIRKVISAQSVIPAADSFIYIIKKGSNVSSLDLSRLREFLLSEESANYKLEVGFVPLKKGVFRVLIEDASNVYRRRNSCPKAYFAVKFVNLDPHYYLGYNISGNGVYYFKVY